MPVTDGHRQSLRTLLRELDASGDAEFPRDFDRTATRERFGELVARIDGLGYLSVPGYLLWADCDGVLNLRSHARSWLDRFFFWI